MRLFQEHGTTVPLAARLITLARFPVFRTVARQEQGDSR
jgi:hypothetical protein